MVQTLTEGLFTSVCGNPSQYISHNLVRMNVFCMCNRRNSQERCERRLCRKILYMIVLCKHITKDGWMDGNYAFALLLVVVVWIIAGAVKLVSVEGSVFVAFLVCYTTSFFPKQNRVTVCVQIL